MGTNALAGATLRLLLKQVRHEAEGVASYEFVAPDGAALPAFTAGAHIDLRLPGDLVRSYSLVNAPSDHRRYVIAVNRDRASRGGSAWLHEVPRVGAVLEVAAPLNGFALDEGAALSVFVAGGIGITPFVSMARRLSQLGRRWQLHYAVRTPGHAAFAGELRSLADASGGELFIHHGSDGMGRLDVARIVRAAPAEAHLYCCGPGGMIDDFMAAGAGRNPATLHHERFAASQDAATGGGYEVVLARSARTLSVTAGKTILDTLLDAGVDAQYACMQGVCGTCRTGVLEGTPDHRDEYLTDEEKASCKTVMICCSGSLSPRLVLDL